MQASGEPILVAEDLDYWFSLWAWQAYSSGRGRSMVVRALAGLVFFYPEVWASLSMSRQSLRGWSRLAPPRPYAPMPRELVWAVASVARCRNWGALAVGLLVAFDCWLRISEVSALLVDHVVDRRSSSDSVFSGVVVYLPHTKTGHRQAVRVLCPHVSSLLIQVRDATARDGPTARLFPFPDVLRKQLSSVLSALLGPDREMRGLKFVWHSARHGGASRAYAEGMAVEDILMRGRWRQARSATRYLQTGRAMLLASQLPREVHALASRYEQFGLARLLDPNFHLLF